jgi:hypothetical protein
MAVPQKGWLVKLDAGWNVEWQVDYGELNVGFGAAIELAVGGYAVAAATNGRPLLLRLDEQGRIHWQRVFLSYGGFAGVHETCDGGLLAVADVQGGAWLVEVDRDGHVLWQRAEDGDVGYGVSASVMTAQGDVAAVGPTGSEGRPGPRDAAFVFVSRTGRLDAACARSHSTDYATEAGTEVAVPADATIRTSGHNLTDPRGSVRVATLPVTTACEGPAEVTAQDMPAEPGGLRVCCSAGDSLTLTFDEVERASAFNVHEGTLGTWYQPRSMSCHLRSGGDLMSAAGGRLSLGMTPGSGDAWFLVSSSSCLGESSLGRASFAERDAPASAWRCGTLP